MAPKSPFRCDSCISRLLLRFYTAAIQMLLAAALAILCRCNLPISIVFVWISDPLTVAPLFLVAYKIGAWILNRPMEQELTFTSSLGWITSQISTIWQPFLLGCFTTGAVLALFGYMIIQLIWRIRVAQSWKQRKLAKAPNHNNNHRIATGASH